MYFIDSYCNRLRQQQTALGSSCSHSIQRSPNPDQHTATKTNEYLTLMEEGVSYALLSPPLWSQLDSCRLSDRLHALSSVTESILSPIESSSEEEGKREWQMILWKSLLSAFIRLRYLEGRWMAELKDSIRRISGRAVDLEEGLRADLCSSLRELAPFKTPESQVINYFVTIGVNSCEIALAGYSGLFQMWVLAMYE